MGQPIAGLVSAVELQLRKCSDNDIQLFSAALAEHGGFLDLQQEFVVPAAAVLVSLRKTLQQLLSLVPGAVTRSKAAGFHLEALINAALAVLSSSSSQGAGVQQTFLHVSDKAPSQHVTSHSRYLGLLQAAADTTGARSTQPAGAAKPGKGKLQVPPGKVPALHFPSVRPGMAPEEVEAAVLAAVCTQLGRAVPPAADQAPAAACDNAAHAPPVPQSPAVAAPAAAQAQLAAAEPAAADGLAQPVQQAAAAALGVDASPPQPLMPPWDQENATARNLGKFQGQLKDCCCDHDQVEDTLLYALLQALQLTQPWTDTSTADLAAGGAASDALDNPGGGTNLPAVNSRTCRSSSSGSLSHLEQARQLIQGSPTLTAVWPDLMDMIRQGHLQQPNVDKPHQLCFMGGSTFFAQTWRSGKGGSCSVYMVKLADGSERAIKQYNVDAFLHRADQEVRALQRVTRKGCRYILPLEGIALMAYRERRLMVGLVMPVGKQTLGGRYKRGSRVKQEEELRALLFQMLLGVYELHFHCTWHRDLSLNNWIFCDSTPSAAFSYRSEQLMLIDLGASKLLEELHPHQALSVIYTPGFGAPEYVKKAQEMANSSAAPGSESAYKTPMPGPPSSWPKADIWSLGVIALYLWFGDKPAWLDKEPCDTPQEAARRVEEHGAALGRAAQEHQRAVDQQRQETLLRTAGPEVAAAVAEMVAALPDPAAAWVPPAGLVQLLSGCLVQDPASRKTARELLALPWFDPERRQMLQRAQAQGAAAAAAAAAHSPAEAESPLAAPGAMPPLSPSASYSLGPALDALLEEWRQQPAAE